MEERLDLDCGIPYARIAAWLSDELQLAPAGDGLRLFVHGSHSCRIGLEPLDSSRAGPLTFERSRLTASGNPQAVARFKHLFTLRFISAGG